MSAADARQALAGVRGWLISFNPLSRRKPGLISPPYGNHGGCNGIPAYFRLCLRKVGPRLSPGKQVKGGSWNSGGDFKGAARGVGPALAGLTMALLAACSSPEPALYTIAPVPGRVQTGGPKIVAVQQIAIAKYLDREHIVRSSENYRLDVMANDWWGEPLAGMLSRVLVAELGQRLPGSVVLAENGAVAANPDAVIQLNIERLDEGPAGNLVLAAQAAVRFKGRARPELRRFRFVVPPPAAGVPGEVAAISAGVGRLADGLVPMLLAGGHLR